MCPAPGWIVAQRLLGRQRGHRLRALGRWHQGARPIEPRAGAVGIPPGRCEAQTTAWRQPGHCMGHRGAWNHRLADHPWRHRGSRAAPVRHDRSGLARHSKDRGPVLRVVRRAEATLAGSARTAHTAIPLGFLFGSLGLGRARGARKERTPNEDEGRQGKFHDLLDRETKDKIHHESKISPPARIDLVSQLYRVFLNS